MILSKHSIRRPIATIMMVLLVVILGIISLNRLNIDLYPDITFPRAVVITNYSGVGPEEIESLITEPLESNLSTINNVKNITSTSTAGSSQIVMEYNWGTDMDFAVMDMRENVDLVESFLPDEAEKPLIFKFDPSMMPIMRYGISNGGNLADLKKLVEDKIVPRLEKLEGVATANLIGGLEREIQVRLDQNKMNNYGVTFSDVTTSLMMENKNISGGKVKRGFRELLVRTTGKFESVSAIGDILISNKDKALVKLEDIAQVRDSYKDIETIARLDQNTSVGLTIQKQTDANTVKVANRVKAEISSIKQNSEEDLKIALASDQASFIEDAIANVRNNALIGGLLAIIILFLFLKNFRSTFIIGTAIPVSIIATFLLMYFSGLTLNIISLGGLALGVGMLVDNSIVVLENIYRYRRQGLNRFNAADKGSTEVGTAITASTLTTIVVFVPIVFVQGMASQLFKELAMTISYSLLASLLVSLSFIPMLSSKILKINKEKKDEAESLGIIRKKYKQLLEWSLNHRWIIVVMLVIMLAGSASLFPFIGTEFLPSMDQGEFSITYNLPVGTRLEETDATAKKIEDIVAKIPEVETIFTNVGSSNQMNMGTSTQTGSIQVKLVPRGERERTVKEIMESLRQRLRFPDVEIDITTQSRGPGGGGGNPVNLKLMGDNLEKLEDLSAKAVAKMETVAGLREVEDSFEEGRPELQIKIDRSLAAQFGLTVKQVGDAVKTAVDGTVATRYEVAGEEYDIRVMLKQQNRDSLNKISSLSIPTPTGTTVSLNRVAQLELDRGPKEILRKNQQRYSEITAGLYKTDLGTAMGKVKQKLSTIELPENYEFSYEGEFQDQQESFRSLFFAFILALILVYMVMASQFESLVHPFVIMFTVPMALIGVLLGLFITGEIISVASLIGVITLAGIVVNNAIVLIDYINHIREHGKDKHEAILEAGPIRFRPILMTALTTVLGLTPLALGFGQGAEMMRPISIVVISGLMFATFLTLVFVPVLYSLFTDASDWIKFHIKKVI